jgi:hypothetical protein
MNDVTEQDRLQRKACQINRLCEAWNFDILMIGSRENAGCRNLCTSRDFNSLDAKAHFERQGGTSPNKWTGRKLR